MAFNGSFKSSSYDLDKERDSFAVPRISISQLNDEKSASKENDGKNDAPERGQWSKGIQSLLLCLSMSVGLGNIWRFPNIAYNNGGGAFLIPYLLLLFIIGRPLYYLELILGQFCSQGPIKMWRIVPAFKGVGYAQVISVSFILVFYNYLMALSVFYIFSSMQSCLPWTDCTYDNYTVLQNASAEGLLAPSEQFWMQEILLKSSGNDDQLTVSWKLFLCLLATWIIVYITVIQGTNSLGKMSYFTAFFPFFGLIALLIIACLEEGSWEGIKFSVFSLYNMSYFTAFFPFFGLIALLIIACLEEGSWEGIKFSVFSLYNMSYFTAFFPFFGLIALLIIACLEEGSWEGIKFFFKPDLEKLKDINVWYKATEQSFFSLTVAYGNIVMIASYNKFHNNVYRDAIIISVLDTFVNILAGCVSFAVLGSLSHKYAKDIREVVNHEGLGLAFIVYPEALAAIKYVPQLWSVIFFFMLFVLGVGSSMSMIETILTIIKDKFPVLRKKKWLLAMGICSMFFALGVPLTTNVGQLILVILNNYGAGIAVFFYAVLELVGVMWIYGLKNFCQDVEFMLNKPPGIFWKVTWAFTAPVALTIIFIIGIIDAESTVDPTLPNWASAVGWFLAALALVQIPLWFIVAVYRDPHIGVIKKILSALKPAENWGPSDPAHNADWRAMKMAARKNKIPVNLASTVSAAYQNQSYKEDVF